MANVKKKSFLDSLWFNTIMSFIAVVALAEHVINNYISGDYFHSFVLIIAWVIIVFHFVYATIKAAKQNKTPK